MSAYAIACIQHQLDRKPGFYQPPQPSQSSLAMPCDDLMDLIGKAVINQREQDARDYWTEGIAGSGFSWHIGTDADVRTVWYSEHLQREFITSGATITECISELEDQPRGEMADWMGLKKTPGVDWCSNDSELEFWAVWAYGPDDE